MQAPDAKLDWADIPHKLEALCNREAMHGGGPAPYTPLSMFKLILPGQWHGSVSDDNACRA